ncbi:MAG: hypothetical protein ABW166_18510 [Sedimenticola sp.]
MAETEEGLARIRAAARKDGTLRFNNLLHHITVERLWQAYDGLKKRAAAGVDGVTWHQYGENLLPNLTELHKRIQMDRYRAQPVKRGWIGKGDGSKRPLGITCVEDKIVQQAVVWILEQIYEPPGHRTPRHCGKFRGVRGFNALRMRRLIRSDRCQSRLRAGDR